MRWMRGGWKAPFFRSLDLATGLIFSFDAELKVNKLSMNVANRCVNLHATILQSVVFGIQSETKIEPFYYHNEKFGLKRSFTERVARGVIESVFLSL